jgi:uncharacterized protein (DUF2384 family)
VAEDSSQPSARIAVNAFKKLADRWELGQAERARLLGRSDRTAYRWAGGAGRADRPLHRDTLERIALLIGIHEDVRVVLGPGEAASGWLRRPNADFGGRTPLEHLLGGNVADIVDVRRYLALARHA